MDREQFLKNLKRSKAKLVSLQIDGWDGLVYLQPQTVGEIRDTLLRDDGAASPKEALTKDALYLARQVARIIRDEHGTLLFNADSDDEMKVLMEVMAEAGPEISRQINKKYNEINSPTKEEVTDEGNSPSVKSS